MTKSKIIAIIAVLGLAISILYHRHTKQALESQIDSLETAAANARVAQESANAATENGAADQDRIAKDRSELMRLRAEVTALRAELQKSRGAAPPPKQSPTANPKPAAELEPRLNLRTYNSSISTTVPIGGAALTGGWVTAPGKRTFVFMSPAVVNPNATTPGGERQVTMSGRIVEIPDGVFQPTFPNVTHNADDTYSGSIGANEMHDLLAKLEATEGVNVLSAPRVTTNEGMEAVVAVTHSVVQDGQDIALGPQISLSSRIGADGSFKMDINSKMTLLPTEE